jgi:hypothetical protein
MLGKFAALLALACLAGCDDDNDLLVTNGGTQPVIVEISTDNSWSSGHEHDIFELPAGSVFREDYNSDDVDVFIYRKSDGLILFASHYDRDDFEDDHGTIEITVIP